jgi:arylsulfatase A-like enzyme
VDRARTTARRIDRRAFLSGAVAPLVACASRGNRNRPNLIFILADDLGCYGQKKIRTPNIDRLAAEGMKFNQAYAGASVCAPSRSCLMTGLHTGHTTVRHNFSVRTGERVALRAEDVTVAKLLKQAGYGTAVFGKWGLGEPGTPGLPNRQGFDEWFGYLNQDHATDFYTNYLWRNESKQVLRGNLNGGRREYTHDLFTREAIQFIRARQREPLFLYLAYTIPHSKREVPSDEPYSNEPRMQEQKNYAAMITRMDQDVGRILALLKETGLDEKTLLFFSSDNGAGFQEGIAVFGSSGPLRDRKGSVYEGGLRVPLLARWPGRIRPGTHTDEPCAFWDFLPTAVEVAGAAPPPSIDGISMLPTFLGKPPKNLREHFYWEAFGKGFQQAVCIDNWKGVRHGLDKPLEVYDLSRDEAESTDIAARHPEIVTRMQEILRKARTEAAEYPPDVPPARPKKQKADVVVRRKELS